MYETLEGKSGKEWHWRVPVLLFGILPVMGKVKQIVVGGAVTVYLGGVAIDQGGFGVLIKGSDYLCQAVGGEQVVVV